MNIAQAIMHLFPQANPMQDFIVQDDSDGNGPYIAQWNLEEPQPTEEDLQAAWDELQIPPEPVEETDAQKIARLEAENVAKDVKIAELAARDTQLQDDQLFIMDALVVAGIL